MDGYVDTGSGVEETLAANDEAWRRIFLRPRVLRDVSQVDTSTSVLGTSLRAPVAIAPTGFQRRLHPDAEGASAAGALAAGSLFVMSTRASCDFATVADTGAPWWFQVYILRDRELTTALVRAAATAGATALVFTVDTPYVAAKARNINGPAGATIPLLPELADRSDEGTWQSPALSYDDIGWLREISGLPVVVKGVLRGDDARACVDAGAAAIYVSNHGGRQLDGAVPTAIALPEVAATVGDDVEVYVDGGIRTGRDVLRACGLGARAAFLGRPPLWSLGEGGADGVRDLLLRLGTEFREALALSGCTSVDDVRASGIVT